MEIIKMKSKQQLPILLAKRYGLILKAINSNKIPSERKIANFYFI